MTRLTYEEARDLIQDGDIVFIHGSWIDPVSAVIMLVTASLFSHVCIAFWVKTNQGKMLMCVESQGQTRRRIFPLSFYGDNKMTVVAGLKPWKTVQNLALSKVGKAEYGMIEAVYVGVKEFVYRHTNYKLPDRPAHKEYCSTFVASVYGLETLNVSPQTLYEQLLQVSNVRGIQTED